MNIKVETAGNKISAVFCKEERVMKGVWYKKPEGRME